MLRGMKINWDENTFIHSLGVLLKKISSKGSFARLTLLFDPESNAISLIDNLIRLIKFRLWKQCWKWRKHATFHSEKNCNGYISKKFRMKSSQIIKNFNSTNKNIYVSLPIINPSHFSILKLKLYFISKINK